jgi:RHS repeat-associated protein
VQYGYTPNGKPASLTDGQVPTGNVTSYAYDGLDRLATTTWPDSSTEGLGYDADGNVLTRKTRAGPTITTTYDTLNRRRTKAAPGEPTVSYAYDPAGRVSGVSDTSAALAVPGTSSGPFASLYRYDALNRPTGVTWSPAPPAVPPAAASVTFTHTYSPANQRLGQSVSDRTWLLYPPAAATTRYSTNALNQYAAVGSVTPAYDGNGNLTFDGTFTDAYDAENRLVSITQGSTAVAAYAYDGRGRRKTKTVGATSTVFVTDADDREVLEYDGSSGQVGRWYAYGLGPNAVLNQMNVAAGTRQTLIPDLQGSVLATLDSSSGTLSKAGYLLFGENAAVSAGTFRFTGQRFDAETAGSAAEPSGLYYARARMYAPTLGRFLQPDPIGYQGGVHLYAYVGNDPLNLTDPSGLCDNPQGCGGGSSNQQSAATVIQLAAAGDLQCQGFSSGCQNGGSSGTTAMYGISGRNLCPDCAVKMLGIEDEPAAEKVIILRPFLLPGR